MSHIFRAKRDFDLAKSTTTCEIGPGSYDLSERKKKTSSAPFSSTTARNFGSPRKVEETPGPGAYDSPLRAPGSGKTGYISTAPRFEKPKVSFAPGPGQYNSSVNTIAGSAAKIRPRQTMEPIKPAAVEWVRQTTAPSIPRGPQTFGYEETPSRVLVQQPPPPDIVSGTERDSVGPGQYELGRKPLGKASISSSWARSSSARGTYIPKRNTPGVGEYVPDATFAASIATSKSAAFSSDVPRFAEHDTIAPGPGRYNLRGGPAVHGTPSSVQGFGHTTRPCNVPLSCDAPGPGDYNIPGAMSGETNSRLKYKTLAQRGSGVDSFNTSAPRFREMPSEVPGPGTYNAGPPKTRMPARIAPFGGTLPRFMTSGPAAARQANPGPGAYELRGIKSRNRKRGSAAFRDTTDRFDGPGSFVQIEKAAPPPPEYEIVESINQHHQRERNGAGRKPQGPTQVRAPFGSTTSGDRNSFVRKTNVNAPGPGAYDGASVNAVGSGGGGIALPRGSRFQEARVSDAPGPGYYYVPTDGLTKKSFNVTIDPVD